MDRIGILVFGQTEEQVQSNYEYTSDYNKEFFRKLRVFLYENSIQKNMKLNLYTTNTRGLGFTAITTGISLKNEFEDFIPLIQIEVISPDKMNDWTYSDLDTYSRLSNLVDKSQTVKSSDEQWAKAGIRLVDKSDIVIIATPKRKIAAISEVMRYAFNNNKKVYRYDEETKEFKEVSFVELMLY